MTRNHPGLVTLVSLIAKEALKTTGTDKKMTSINITDCGSQGIILVVLNTKADKTTIAVFDLWAGNS